MVSVLSECRRRRWSVSFRFRACRRGAIALLSLQYPRVARALYRILNSLVATSPGQNKNKTPRKQLKAKFGYGVRHKSGRRTFVPMVAFQAGASFIDVLLSSERLGLRTKSIL